MDNINKIPQTGGGKNEAVTDDIVRDYFKRYERDIVIERQSSRNPSIDKLLRNASKKRRA